MSAKFFHIGAESALSADDACDLGKKLERSAEKREGNRDIKHVDDGTENLMGSHDLGSRLLVLLTQRALYAPFLHIRQEAR